MASSASRSRLKYLKAVAALALLALVVSNAVWYLTYLSWRQHETACLKDNAKALAVMLGLIASALRNQSRESLSLAYATADHAVMIAQALRDLEGSHEWETLLSAVASLRDLVSNMYQGRRISYSELTQVEDAIAKLSQSLNTLDLNGINEYSRELLTLLAPLGV